MENGYERTVVFLIGCLFSDAINGGGAKISEK